MCRKALPPPVLGANLPPIVARSRIHAPTDVLAMARARMVRAATVRVVPAPVRARARIDGHKADRVVVLVAGRVVAAHPVEGTEWTP